jgi:hypothetical protein
VNYGGIGIDEQIVTFVCFNTCRNGQAQEGELEEADEGIFVDNADEALDAHGELLLDVYHVVHMWIMILNWNGENIMEV